MRHRFSLRERAVLFRVADIAAEYKCDIYLVGGFLRDLLLGRKSRDIDFAVRKGAVALARKTANRLRAGFVVLDKRRGCARVIIRRGDKGLILDFTDFRGRDIEQDLAARDFSINALAVDLALLRKGRRLRDVLLDPYRAAADIENGCLRLISPQAIDEDPLRMLRAFSLAATLGFSFAPQTLTAITRKRRRLSSVSAERVREELFKMLAAERAAMSFRRLDKAGLLEVIIPEIKAMRGLPQGPYHHLNVLQHCFETMEKIEGLFEELKRRRRIGKYLDEACGGDHCRRQILKLSAFLHDVGKPAAMSVERDRTRFHGHEHIGRRLSAAICARLKMSLREIQAIKTIVSWHLRPGYLADNPVITPRALFRYFRDTAEEGVSVLLLSIADQRATRGPLTSRGSRIVHEKTCLRLINEYFRRRQERVAPRLITGNDLINRLHLAPGPIFGKILKQVEEEQAAGNLSVKRDALVFARRLSHRLSGRRA